MIDLNRYGRQIILPNFGIHAQQKLQQAKVLIVGMGALGCPALQYLAGAGIGVIGIADGDDIQLHNLHRQPLFYTADINHNKAIVAAEKMRALNPDIQLTVYPFYINNKNALSILQTYDIVIDATDNFPTKYLLNDACALLKKPLVYGAVSRYEGQLSLFNYCQPNGRNIQYRDLFPEPPHSDAILSCEEAGVLGVLPGVMGIMQATEAIKVIAGLGRLLDGVLLTYHALSAKFYEMEISKNPAVQTMNKAEFENIDYDWLCNSNSITPSLSVEEFKHLQQLKQLFIIDIREHNEIPIIDFADVHIPYSTILSANHLPQFPNVKNICVICQRGIRSKAAAAIIQQQAKQKVYHLMGGLSAYFNQ